MKTKFVRIDNKTVIEVKKSKPIDEARNEFLLKIEDGRRKHDNREVYKRWK